MTENSGTGDGDEPNDPHGNHKKLYHWVYVAGFCLVSAFINFVFLWPVNHLAALLFLATSLSLPAIYELTAFGIRPRYVWAAVTTLYVASLVVYQAVGPLPRVETETHGWLIPAQDSSAQTVCPDHPWGMTARFELPEKMLTVALGHSGATIPFVFGTDPSEVETTTKFNSARRTILKVGQCVAVAMTRTDDGLSVDADVFNSSGEIAASIKENEFHLVPAQYGFTERPDRSTLIVYGKQKEELFWVRFLNPRSVKMRGYFACQRSPIVHVAEDAIFVDGSAISQACFVSRPNGVAFEFH